MSKPRGVRWLEDKTGQELDHEKLAGGEVRHLSVRLPADLLADLERLAAERGENVSQVTRRLITDGLAKGAVPEREAVDMAIAALEKIRGRLTA